MVKGPLRKTMVQSLAGHLLVASTLVEDPVSSHSVCLLVHHDEDGAIGVMLNRPLSPNPEALLAMLGQQDEAQRKPNRLGDDDVVQSQNRTVHFGGPLSGPVVAVHSSIEFAEVETGPGIYVAAQKHHLESLVSKTDVPVRLIVGHFGWQSDQLRDEVAAGVWHLLPATADAVFASDRDMWPRLIRRATARSMSGWMGIHDNPLAWQFN